MPETRLGSEILHGFPAFRHGILVALGMDNHGSSAELQELLDESLAAGPGDARARPLGIWTAASE